MGESERGVALALPSKLSRFAEGQHEYTTVLTSRAPEMQIETVEQERLRERLRRIPALAKASLCLARSS